VIPSSYEPMTSWLAVPPAMSLHEVAGVSVDPRDVLYLLTRNPKNPIMVFAPDGTFIRTFGAGTFTDRAHAIRVGPDEFLYCVDDAAQTVTKWSTTGELVMTIGVPGHASARFSGEPFNGPTDAAVDDSGRIFISDGYGNARIHRYAANGTHEISWGTPGIEPGSFMVPHNLCLAGDRLYVADREAHRIQVFDLDGELVDVWNGIHRPCAITFGPDSHLYVGELTGAELMEGAPGVGHRVSIFDQQGRLVARVGDPIEGEAPGQFIAPHGIAVNQAGDVFVGEVSFTIRGRFMDPPRELKSFTRLRRLS
jgi:sugar lactone lactonase YvrE